jgi:hypothetical protein
VSIHRVIAAGNTVVPALLSLEELGFNVIVRNHPAGQTFTARRDDEEYSADDPVTLLGLVKLVEVRSWQWNATDSQIDAIMIKYQLGSASDLSEIAS